MIYHDDIYHQQKVNQVHIIPRYQVPGISFFVHSKTNHRDRRDNWITFYTISLKKNPVILTAVVCMCY